MTPVSGRGPEHSRGGTRRPAPGQVLKRSPALAPRESAFFGSARLGPVLLALLGLALLGLAAGSAPARALGASPAPRFTITYSLSFLNLRVGEATLSLEHAPDRDAQRYALELAAGLRGLAGFFVDGTGKAMVAGSRARGGAVTATFRVDSRYAGKPIAVTLDLAGGRVREAVVEPPPTPRPDRVPVAPEDRVGVVDPLTMLMVPLGPARVKADRVKADRPESDRLESETLYPALCDRRIPVFDGATRADLVLSRGGVVTVTEGAYRGPALDCRVRWVPISGHRAQGPNVRRMAENDDLRVRFAPVPDGTLLLPLSIAVATGWGTVRIDATRWGGEATAPAEKAGVKVRLPGAR